MTTFDPSKHQNSDFQALAAGTYVVAMTKYERKTSQKGTQYLRATFKVVHGRAKGKTFFSSVGLDTSKEGTATRLGLYCRAVGVTKAFDLDNDGALEAAFLGKPFKAQVNQTQNGQYVNNDIQKYVFELTSDEAGAAEDWWADWQAKARDRSDPGGGGDDWNADDYETATNSGGRNRRAQDDDFGDPDIPF